MKEVGYLSFLLVIGCSKKIEPVPTLFQQFEKVCQSEMGIGVVEDVTWSRLDFEGERAVFLEESPKSPLGRPLLTYCIAERPIRYVPGTYDGPIGRVSTFEPDCEGVTLSNHGLFCPHVGEPWSVRILTNQDCDTAARGNSEWNVKWVDKSSDVSGADLRTAIQAIMPGRVAVPISDSCWLEASPLEPNPAQLKTDNGQRP